MRHTIARSVVLTAVVLLSTSCASGDGGVVEAGDRFEPPADWVERRELVVEKSIFCAGPMPCPHLERDWDVPGTVPEEDIDAAFSDIGSPTRDSSMSGCQDRTRCTYRVDDGEFRWELTVVEDHPAIPDGVALRVYPSS
jgi:hypothetical protein